MGQSPSSKAYNNTELGLPFLQGRTTFGDKYPSFDTWTTEWNKEAHKDDILFTVRAPVGDINIATTTIAIGRGIASIKPINVSTKYLFYLLSANKRSFLISSAGTIFDSINKDSLENIVLTIHKQEEQHHIVNTIGTVDDLIEKCDDIINKIEVILTLLYKKIESSYTTKLSSCFKCFNGGTFKSSDYVDYSTEKLITIKNIDQNGFSSENPTYFKMSEKYKKYQLSKGDILLTMTGAYLGRSGIVDDDNCFLNQRVLKVHCTSKSLCYIFLKLNEDNIFNLGKGSAQPNLSLEDFYNIDLPFSYNDVMAFEKYDYLFDVILRYKIQKKKLKKIKQFLLLKYF